MLGIRPARHMERTPTRALLLSPVTSGGLVYTIPDEVGKKDGDSGSHWGPLGDGWISKLIVHAVQVWKTHRRFRSIFGANVRMARRPDTFSHTVRLTPQGLGRQRGRVLRNQTVRELQILHSAVWLSFDAVPNRHFTEARAEQPKHLRRRGCGETTSRGKAPSPFSAFSFVEAPEAHRWRRIAWSFSLCSVSTRHVCNFSSRFVQGAIPNCLWIFR